MSIDLRPLLNLAEELPGYRRLLDKLRQPEVSSEISALDAAKPYLIAAIYLRLGMPVLVVTAQPENSKRLYEQLLVWCQPTRVSILPEPDALPYERIASDATTGLERLRTLSALAGNGEAPLVVTSAPALASKTTPYRDFVATGHTVKAGMDTEPLQLLRRWEGMGYRPEGIVEIPGTMSHRGGIIDIYPIASDRPARLEFFGNTVESIRLFDPITQRSQTSVPSINISPATEMLSYLSSNKGELEQALSSIDLSGCTPEVSQQFQQEIAVLLDRQRTPNIMFYASLFNTDSILNYLPGNAVLVLDEPRHIKLAIDDLHAKASELRRDKVERGELPRNFPPPYFTWQELEMANRRSLSLTSWDTADTEPAHRLGFTPAPSYTGQLPMFIKKLKKLQNRKHRVIITSYQASRLSELLEEEDIMASPVTEIKQTPPPGSLTLVPVSVAQGWALGNNTHLFTDTEIFGFTKQQRMTAKRPVPHHRLLQEITRGDYVVHIEHGIARFADIITMRANGSEKEYLVLLYSAGDKLYVPTDQIDRVSRYIGASDQPPSLSRLSTQEWNRTKKQAQESAAAIAQDLLNLYATRDIIPGFAFTQDTLWQQELEASFPYIETPDQIRVVDEVKEDMSQPKPMDRLVSGDVGYGKTEVAIRAAFKAVMDGKQVAVLVPTTVLAEQHFATIKQRLAAFPIRIEVLSRFRTHKVLPPILDGLAGGNVDICIGTHRLLQKDVVFKDLGLLIIDEEQRFGVAHKEYFRKLRQEVDVLTLSATPIPRTLHMSLVGVRDMSTMETPPEERLPIKTYIAEYDERLIREAILRELERNGQVFFVHNRVQSIAFVASKLRSLVPEAEIATAHGQMPETELERVMADFTRGKSDILVCTTIIGSGLDMPRVNTLIVNRADQFGLTQLYQLRGRVGRGANLAYAYFLYDRGKLLTPTAERRLRTIFEATELGSGFDIAMKDLEIRGTGSLLGTKQSGHINAVGFSLYTRLLAEAVEEVKAKRAGVTIAKPSRLPPPAIDLPLPAYIPEEYVADIDSRLHLYQRLANVDEVEQIDEIASELADRFGAPPVEVKNLLYVVKIKVLAARAGIESVSTEEGQIILRLFAGMQFTAEQRLLRFHDGVRISLNQIRLNLKRLGEGWQQVLEEMVEEVLEKVK
ncbi:transcription-repair coupling factor [Chloroflexota bacterium]